MRRGEGWEEVCGVPDLTPVEGPPPVVVEPDEVDELTNSDGLLLGEQSPDVSDGVGTTKNHESM